MQHLSSPTQVMTSALPGDCENSGPRGVKGAKASATHFTLTRHVDSST